MGVASIKKLMLRYLLHYERKVCKFLGTVYNGHMSGFEESASSVDMADNVASYAGVHIGLTIYGYIQ